MDHNLKKYQKTSPFFIVGSGRSGTTLLRLILSSHSEVTIPPETWFIMPLVKEIPIDTYLTENEIDLSFKIITTHYRWPDMGIDTDEFHDKLKKNRNIKLKDIIDIVYDHYLKMENKSIWGDKTPPYIKILPELISLYPEARFIHLIRDGHDVAMSFYKLQWKGRWLANNVTEWNDSIDKYIEYKRTKIIDRILEIKYENLVVDTENTIKTICTFIGLSFEPKMLYWEKEIFNKIPKREIGAHKKVFRRPKKADIYRWKKESSDVDIFIIESYLKKNLKAMGYDVKFENILWAPFQVLLRFYFHISYLLFFFIGYISKLMKKLLAQLTGLGRSER